MQWVILHPAGIRAGGTECNKLDYGHVLVGADIRTILHGDILGGSDGLDCSHGHWEVPT